MFFLLWLKRVMTPECYLRRNSLTYNPSCLDSNINDTTTTTTQAPDKSIWDDDAFVAVFSVLMVILGLALLAALWYFCCRGQNAQCMDFGPR